jgi:hypothetical protein
LSPKTVESALRRHFYRGQKSIASISLTQEKYIKKIAGYCQQKGIKLFLISTPLHEDYKSQIPKIFIEKWDNLMNEICDTYNNVKVINMSDISLSDDCFGDGDHLNTHGAMMVSEKVNNTLKLEAVAKNKNF